MRSSLLLALVLLACEPVDEGFLVVNGLTLHPGPLPATVTATPDAEAVTREAVDWWGEQLGVDALVYVDGDAAIAVEIGLVPWDGEGEEPAGIARLDFDADGAVVAADVVLSSDIAYHAETLAQAMRHEAGHVLALADDCGPPACVDLRSVMASPLDPLGVLTDHDRALLAPYLEGP